MVEARLCRACKTHRSAEHFARDPAKRNGLADVCRSCAPILEREKGIAPGEPLCELTPEEIRALSLMRQLMADAKRARREMLIDWTDILDRLEAGICEDSGRRFAVKKRNVSLRMVRIEPRGKFVAANIKLVIEGVS